MNAIRRLEPDKPHRVLFVLDSHVAEARPALRQEIAAYANRHAGSLELVGAPLVVPGGEEVKNDLAHTLLVLERINDVGLDRQLFVVVIGGGAVLDMASFAAALAHRIIRIVRMPTTVLSQADSGVAVKNGINLFGKKNFIGTFVPPFAVINDRLFLASLEPRDVACGVVEAVKISLLRDPDFFRDMERDADRLRAGEANVLAATVQRSAELHLAHICGDGDPLELGSARPLDFGHWAAHKLEAMTDHRLRHGEAVAIGMALDLHYAVEMGFLEASCAERILQLLEMVGLRLWDEALLTVDDSGDLAILSGLREFREHLGGTLRVTMLRGIGASFEVTETGG